MALVITLGAANAQTKKNTSPDKKPEKEVAAPANQVINTNAGSGSITAKPVIPEAIPQAPVTMNANAVYQIVNYGGKVLEADGDGKRGANVQLQDPAKGENQKWFLVPAGGDFYYIFNESQHYVIHIDGPIISGTNIKLEKPNGSNNQKFKIIPIGNGYYWLQTSNSLNISGQTANAGANGIVKLKGQDIEQRWQINAIQ